MTRSEAIMNSGPIGIHRKDIDDDADDDHCAICLEDDILQDVQIIGESETIGVCDDCLTLHGVDVEENPEEEETSAGDEDS